MSKGTSGTLSSAAKRLLRLEAAVVWGGCSSAKRPAADAPPAGVRLLPVLSQAPRILCLCCKSSLVPHIGWDGCELRRPRLNPHRPSGATVGASAAGPAWAPRALPVAPLPRLCTVSNPGSKPAPVQTAGAAPQHQVLWGNLAPKHQGTPLHLILCPPLFSTKGNNRHQLRWQSWGSGAAVLSPGNPRALPPGSSCPPAALQPPGGRGMERASPGSATKGGGFGCSHLPAPAPTAPHSLARHPWGGGSPPEGWVLVL